MRTVALLMLVLIAGCKQEPRIIASTVITHYDKSMITEHDEWDAEYLRVKREMRTFNLRCHEMGGEVSIGATEMRDGYTLYARKCLKR